MMRRVYVIMADFIQKVAMCSQDKYQVVFSYNLIDIYLPKP